MCSTGCKLLEGLIKSKACLVVTISGCGRSNKIKEVFDNYDVNQDTFNILDIDGRSDTDILQFYMGQKTGVSSVLSALCSVPSERAVPRVFLRGKDFGGWEEVDTAHRYAFISVYWAFQHGPMIIFVQHWLKLNIKMNLNPQPPPPSINHQEQKH